MSFRVRTETKVLSEEEREKAGGSFIQLPNGRTHYEIGGPASGKVVVLVHGFSVPYFIYDPTFEFLTISGFQVVRYDLFGRGYSDRPVAKYDIDLFVQQLSDLLDSLRLTRPVDLVGLSMGGPIVSAFTVRHPERTRKLVLIDPAGAKLIHPTAFLRAAKIPLLPEIILSFTGSEFFLKSAADDFFDPALVKQIHVRYKVQMQYRGFIRSILSTIRNGMLDSFMEMYAALGNTEKLTMLLWGRNDTTVPFAHSELLRSVMPNAEFHVIENCGHIPHYEKPSEVNPILLEFLNR